MPHDRLLDVKNLTIKYNIEGNLVPVVDRVSFYIDPGEVVGLVGESGCGKTQVALAQAGLLPKQALVSENENRNLRTAMIFQDPMNALNPVMKVGKQIAEGIKIKCTEKRKKEKVVSLLEQVEIDEPEKRFDQYPHEFSGGMRQRALIAMSLAMEPDLLIADEPTTALDVTIQGQIINLLKKLNKQNNLSILFISHDLSLVRSFAHRTMVMYAGKIVESGSTEDVYSDPRHPYTKSLLNVAGLGKENGQFITIDGSVPDPQYYPSGCPFHPRCDVAEERCCNEFPELTQVDQHAWNCIHN